MSRFVHTLVVGMAGATLVSAAPQTIVNDLVWRDTSGQEIAAQSGNLLRVGDRFYWYGYDTTRVEVRCYASSDLAHWTFVRTSYQGSRWYGRPKVHYNPCTKEYVMITEAPHAGKNGRNALAYFTAPSPTNLFTLQRKDDTVLGCAMGDHSVFQDTDGKAYLLATTDDHGVTNGTFKIVRLSPDYLHLESVVMSWNCSTDKREAPSLLKVGATYYLFTSGCAGWRSTATKYWKSTSLSQDWSALTELRTSPGSRDSFNTQHAFEITVPGSQGTSYIYAGDRWCQKTRVGVGKNAWYPLTFDAQGVPTLHGCAQWSIDPASGLWSRASESRAQQAEASASNTAVP